MSPFFGQKKLLGSLNNTRCIYWALDMNNSSLKSYRTSSLAFRPFIPLCIMSQYGAFQLFELTHRETNFAHPL